MRTTFTVLVDPKQQQAANRRTYEILYRNWQEAQKIIEKHVSDFWHWPKVDRLANYQALGPVFKVGPRELDEFTLAMENNPNTLDPALVMADVWAQLYAMNPKETMRMVRDSMNITVAAERREQELELQREQERMVMAGFGILDPLEPPDEEEDTEEVEPEYQL